MSLPIQQDPLDCSQCDAWCCRYVATEIDRPTCKRDYDHIRWYLLHKQVQVFVDHDGKWFIEFSTPCEGLDAAGRCRDYQSRPHICRAHGNGEASCEFHADQSPYKERFRTAGEFEKWLDAAGKDWRWKRN